MKPAITSLLCLLSLGLHAADAKVEKEIKSLQQEKADAEKALVEAKKGTEAHKVEAYQKGLDIITRSLARRIAEKKEQDDKAAAAVAAAKKAENDRAAAAKADGDKILADFSAAAAAAVARAKEAKAEQAKIVKEVTAKEIEVLGKDLVGVKVQMNASFIEVRDDTGILLPDDGFVKVRIRDGKGVTFSYAFADKDKYGRLLLEMKGGDEIILSGTVRHIEYYMKYVFMIDTITKKTKPVNDKKQGGAEVKIAESAALLRAAIQSKDWEAAEKALKRLEHKD